MAFKYKRRAFYTSQLLALSMKNVVKMRLASILSLIIRDDSTQNPYTEVLSDAGL